MTFGILTKNPNPGNNFGGARGGGGGGGAGEVCEWGVCQ